MIEYVSSKIPLSITTQALLLGATVGLITYQLFKKKYKLPPGPWSPPLIGNLLSLIGNVPLYKLSTKWRDMYGPIVTMYFGPQPCVILNTPDVVNEALVKKAADFAGRTRSPFFEIISEGYKDIVFADITPAWKMQRKIALQGLRQYLFGNKLAEKIFESTMKVSKIIREKEGEAIDMENHINLIVFSIFHGVCFNKSFDLNDKIFTDIIYNLDSFNKEFGNGVLEDIIPLLRYYPTKKFTRLINKAQFFTDYIYSEFEAHKKTFTEDNIKDFTDSLINARKQAAMEDPNVESMITDVHLAQTVNDVYLAGVDTTRQTLTWTIYLLVAHPEIQKKAQMEIDAVLEMNQAPNITDRERLPYTEAILHESMRLCPVAPLGLPHATRCDTTLGEYEIPKGTMVMINHWGLHMNPDVWSDPEVFRPERLLDEDGKLAPKTMSWLPFSAGRRNCLGESIARPEMHLMLVLLLRNFSFSCPEGKELDLTPGGSLTFIPPKNNLIVKSRQ